LSRMVGRTQLMQVARAEPLQSAAGALSKSARTATCPPVSLVLIKDEQQRISLAAAAARSCAWLKSLTSSRATATKAPQAHQRSAVASVGSTCLPLTSLASAPRHQRLSSTISVRALSMMGRLRGFDMAISFKPSLRIAEPTIRSRLAPLPNQCAGGADGDDAL